MIALTIEWTELWTGHEFYVGSDRWFPNAKGSGSDWTSVRSYTVHVKAAPSWKESYVKTMTKKNEEKTRQSKPNYPSPFPLSHIVDKTTPLFIDINQTFI